MAKDKGKKEKKKPKQIKTSVQFFMSEEEIIIALEAMETNPDLLTSASFRANTEIWPDNSISFKDNHLAYLKSHPAVAPRHYLSNLRLRLRKRPSMCQSFFVESWTVSLKPNIKPQTGWIYVFGVW